MSKTCKAIGGLGGLCQAEAAQPRAAWPGGSWPARPAAAVQDGGWSVEAAEASSLAILHGEGGGLLWSCGRALPPVRDHPWSQEVRVHHIVQCKACFSSIGVQAGGWVTREDEVLGYKRRRGNLPLPPPCYCMATTELLPAKAVQGFGSRPRGRA